MLLENLFGKENDNVKNQSKKVNFTEELFDLKGSLKKDIDNPEV